MADKCDDVIMKDKVIYCMFDGSGIMGLPWAIKGCKVYCFNAYSGFKLSCRNKADFLDLVNLYIEMGERK